MFRFFFVTILQDYYTKVTNDPVFKHHIKPLRPVYISSFVLSVCGDAMYRRLQSHVGNISNFVEYSNSPVATVKHVTLPQAHIL